MPYDVPIISTPGSKHHATSKLVSALSLLQPGRGRRVSILSAGLCSVSIRIEEKERCSHCLEDRAYSKSPDLMTALTRKGQTGVTIFTDHEVVTGGGPWGTSARKRRSLWIGSTEGVRHPHCGHICARMQFHNVRFVSEACNWWVAEDVDLIINFFDLFESRIRLPAVRFGSFPGPVVDPHVRELAWHSDGWAVGCSGDGLHVWCVSFGAERR